MPTTPTAISPEGVALVKRFEGFRAAPAPLPDGGWTAGYGKRYAAPPATSLDEPEAARALQADLEDMSERVRAGLYVTVTQAQFDALVSLAYSIGVDAFLASDVLSKLNAGDLIGAADAFENWRLASASGEPRPLAALARRRAAEKALFLSDDAPAPSAMVQAVRDDARARLAEARLREILAAEPFTAHALTPPPPPAPEEPDLPLPPPSVRPTAEAFLTQGERLALAALCAFGLGMIGVAAIGIAGAPGASLGPLAFAAAPGLTALAAAAYATFVQRA